MALEIVGMAALEAALGSLLSGVIAVIRSAIMFQSQLRDIKSTLDACQELAHAIALQDDEASRSVPGLQNFIIQLEEGLELIRECSDVGQRKLNATKIPFYTERLTALDGRLKTLLTVLAVHITADVRAKVNRMATVVNQIDGNVAAQHQNQNEVRIWSPAPEPPEFTVGLEEPLEEVKRTLLRDDLSMLVVTAPGGMGKTTLAKMFCQDEEVKAIFDKYIIFVTALRRPNHVVVQELCKQTGSQVPTFQDEQTALNWLQVFLRETGQNPVLLVLDDVWPGSESFLDTCNQFGRPNYKILVTSRSQFPRFGSLCSYHFGNLELDDAMTLFRHSTTPPYGTYDIPEVHAKQIVECCGGFPLAITLVGRSLCGQPITTWEQTVADKRNATSKDLLDCLQSSVDALDKTMPIVKECFLDLASFPENQSIPATALIDIWAELYELPEGPELWSVKNLHELSFHSLANLVILRKEKMEGDGYYSEHFVTQHGVLRDLAIHQTGQDFVGQGKRLIIDIIGNDPPPWWTEQKDKPKETRLLSISTDGSFSGKWNNMQLPKAEALVLNFQIKDYALPKYVKKMKKLKVLIVTKYDHFHAELSNYELLGSLPNLKRIQLKRISIPSISKKSTQMKSLQKISLFMCKIGTAFSDSSFKFFKALPNLVELNIDYCDDLMTLPAMLCDLIRLEKLSITNCHKLSALPQENEKLVNLQVLRLRSCTDLVYLPNSITKLANLKFLDISDCFSIKELPEHIGEMRGLKKINMRQCSRLQELPVSVFDILDQLEEVVCDDDTNDLWEPFSTANFSNLHMKVLKEEVTLNFLRRFQS